MLDEAVRRRQSDIVFPLIKEDITARPGGDLPVNKFRQTSLWSCLKSYSHWETELRSLAVFTQWNVNRQNGITRWEHLLVFRKFRPLCKKEETFLLWLWTCLFFPPPQLPESLSPFPIFEACLWTRWKQMSEHFSQGTLDKLYGDSSCEVKCF